MGSYPFSAFVCSCARYGQRAHVGQRMASRPDVALRPALPGALLGREFITAKHAFVLNRSPRSPVGLWRPPARAVLGGHSPGCTEAQCLPIWLASAATAG